MSLKVGLGHNENDLEIQGEIDFDFFDSRPNESNQKPESNRDENTISAENKPREIMVDRDSRMDNSQPSTSQVENCIEIHSKKKTDKCKKTQTHNQSMESMHSEIPKSEALETSKQIYLIENAKKTRKIIKTNVIIPRLDGKSDQSCLSETTSNAKIVMEQRSLSSDSIFMDVSKGDDGSSSGGASSQSSSISMSDSDGESSISDGSIDGLTDSESITDVTPLNSPYFCDSPRPQSTCSRLIDKPKKAKILTKRSSVKEMDYLEDNISNPESLNHRKKDNVRFEDDINLDSTSSNQTNGPIDLNILVAAIKKLEVQQNSFLNISKSRNCSTPPIGARSRPLLQRATTNKSRKNMSFSNDEVRRIDQENQRLLKKLVTQQGRQKPKLAFGLNGSIPMRGIYTPSSQVNRRRRQRQIEIENVAILKRIEAAKPSAELTRSHLLRDYNRLAHGSPSLSCMASSRPSSSIQSLSPRNTNFHRSYSLSSLPTSSETNSVGLFHGRNKLNSAPVDGIGRQRNSQ